jgi:hypothetical protein
MHSNEARLKTSSAITTSNFGAWRNADIHKGERHLLSVRREFDSHQSELSVKNSRVLVAYSSHGLWRFLGFQLPLRTNKLFIFNTPF